MSWAGKILRVNLTAGTVKSEPLNMDWARAYLGSRGLATKYLVEEIDPKVDPLSADNKIIWATGPLTGTMASTGGRYTVVTKGPLTGAIACSNSGGYWGAELKMAGWDMVIFEGESPKPVYLYINDDVAELRDAGHLWGTDRLADRGAAEEGPPGPAAARLQHRRRGREPGAVRGRRQRPAPRRRPLGRGRGDGQQEPEGDRRARHQGRGQHRRPQGLHEGHRPRRRRSWPTTRVTGQGLPTYGTQVLMNVINEVGALPTRNHRDVQFEGAKDISAEAMATPRATDGKKHAGHQPGLLRLHHRLRPHPARSTRATSRWQNKPQYWGASGGLEYEAAWALGAANGVNDLEALQYANLLCNEHGMDPITFGATVGAVMELYEMGVLTKEQIGIDAKFGSAAGAGALCRDHGQGRRLRQGDRPGQQAADRQVRPPRPVA